MDVEESDEDRDEDRGRLARLELVLAALERRHKVVDVIWSSADDAEAEERLRELLDVPVDVPLRVVLDLYLGRLTEEARSRLAADAGALRQSLD